MKWHTGPAVNEYLHEVKSTETPSNVVSPRLRILNLCVYLRTIRPFFVANFFSTNVQII